MINRSNYNQQINLKLVESLCNSNEFIANLDMLRADSFTTSAFDAFSSFSSAVTTNQPIFLITRLIYIVVHRENIHRSERAGNSYILWTNFRAVIA